MVFSVYVTYVLMMGLYIAGVFTSIINLPFLVSLGIEGVIFLFCLRLMSAAISTEL